MATTIAAYPNKTRVETAIEMIPKIIPVLALLLLRHLIAPIIVAIKPRINDENAIKPNGKKKLKQNQVI